MGKWDEGKVEHALSGRGAADVKVINEHDMPEEGVPEPLETGFAEVGHGDNLHEAVYPLDNGKSHSYLRSCV